MRALQRPQQADKFYQEAIDVYDEVVAKDKSNPLVWTDRGFVLLQLNRPQDAFASYDRALKIDPNFYEALLGKASAYNSVKDYQQALSLLDRAIKIRPQDYQVWYNRGNLLLQALNNPEEASKSFQQATKLKGDFYPAWLALGLSQSTLQKYNDAKESLITAQKLNPQDPYLWLNLGIVLEELEEFEDALDAYRTAAIELEFQPANERYRQLEQKINL